MVTPLKRKKLITRKQSNSTLHAEEKKIIPKIKIAHYFPM